MPHRVASLALDGLRARIMAVDSQARVERCDFARDGVQVAVLTWTLPESKEVLYASAVNGDAPTLHRQGHSGYRFTVNDARQVVAVDAATGGWLLDSLGGMQAETATWLREQASLQWLG